MPLYLRPREDPHVKPRRSIKQVVVAALRDDAVRVFAVDWLAEMIIVLSERNLIQRICYFCSKGVSHARRVAQLGWDRVRLRFVGAVLKRHPIPVAVLYPGDPLPVDVRLLRIPGP